MFHTINLYFGDIGRIVLRIKPKNFFIVKGLNNCVIIRNHLQIYSLMIYKLVYFQLWSAIINIILTGAHLTWEGLFLIIAYKAHFKSGLPELLKRSFAEFIPIPQPNYSLNLFLINMHFITGFIKRAPYGR